MPVAGSIQWKPLRDPHYVIASLQPDQGGLRQLVVAQSVLLRVQTIARAVAPDELLGLLIGQRWDCPLSGKRWVLIDSLVEGTATVPDARTLTANLGALIGRRRPDGTECVGWYCGTTASDAHLSRMFAAVHAATFEEPWQPALVLANGGNGGAFFLHDTRDARWFLSPFYELGDGSRNSRRQLAQPTTVSWPEYITTSLVTPLIVAKPVVPPPPSRPLRTPRTERVRPVRVEVVVDSAPAEPTIPVADAVRARMRDASTRLATAGASAWTSVRAAVARVGPASARLVSGAVSGASTVKTSAESLGRHVAARASAAAQARKERAAAERQAHALREAEERRRREERARREAERARREAERVRQEAEQRARDAAARAAREKAERAAKLEAERIAREEAERTARLRAERAAMLEAEQRARQEADARARLAAAERTRVEAERVLLEAAERAKQQAAERARQQAVERARQQAAERARQEADARARLEAAERTRVEAERVLLEAAERARQQAAERAQAEAAERARAEAAERAQAEAAERARAEAAERARAEAAARAEREAADRAKQEAEREAADRAKQEAERRARLEAEQRAAAPARDRAVPRVVSKERSTASVAEDLEDTTSADGPYRYLALARREGFQVTGKLERGTPERPETVWLLNEADSGLRLTVVTTDEEVREASLHYNLRTDDDALLRITPPEHRDVDSRTIYVREPCIAELRSRCRRLRATGALAREWTVTPTLHPHTAPAQYR
jgi:hypothetical protein